MNSEHGVQSWKVFDIEKSFSVCLSPEYTAFIILPQNVESTIMVEIFCPDK